MDGYVSKPIRWSELRAAIAQAVAPERIRAAHSEAAAGATAVSAAG